MRTLICLGDSLTFGLRVPHSRAWPRLVEQETGMEVVNLGLSGDTTGGMLARLQSLTPAQDREATLVLVMGGSNDIFYSGTDVGARANMGAMLHQLRHRHMMPVVGIPLPVAVEDAPAQWGQLADFAQAARVLEDYCQWLRQFCQAFRVPLVDFRQDFFTQDGRVRRELFVDGLHPNAQGHALMAKRLIEWGITQC